MNHFHSTRRYGGRHPQRSKRQHHPNHLVGPNNTEPLQDAIMAALALCPFSYYRPNSIPGLLRNFSLVSPPTIPLSSAQLGSLIPQLDPHPVHTHILLYHYSPPILSPHISSDLHTRIQFLAAPGTYGSDQVLMDLYLYVYNRENFPIDLDELRIAIKQVCLVPGKVPMRLWDQAVLWMQKHTSPLQPGPTASPYTTDQDSMASTSNCHLPYRMENLSPRQVILFCLARQLQPLPRPGVLDISMSPPTCRELGQRCKAVDFIHQQGGMDG